MIAFLHGVLCEKRADAVVLDVGGVGYLVQISLQTLGGLPQIGEQARLHIHPHQAQDAPLALFGFATADERTLFELLISVHGVGPKVAQAMLSGFEPGQLEAAIARKDVGALRRVRGVGGKTAERVVLELKDKVVATPRPSPSTEPEPAHGELVAALVGLGYRAPEAEKAVALAAERAPGAPSDRLLREALKQMQAR